MNVYYIGPNMKGYEPIRFDFLHIRWFQLDNDLPLLNHTGESHSSGVSSHLDQLSFPPMADESSFGFLDPTLVLRACHVIPAFHFGKCYADGIGLSVIARDSNDWKSYYINRYVYFGV